jgi:hypothetical protein
MSKNRKNQSAAVRFGPALKALLACLLIGGAGLGYVWQKNQIHQLGLRIKTLEQRLEALRKVNKRAADHLADLRSPLKLDKRVKELGLGLTQPEPQQILRLVERLPDAASARTAALAAPAAQLAWERSSSTAETVNAR